MNRRDTLKALLVAATSGGFASNLRGMDAAARDKFGGWTGKKFKATGFFRLEKDERWWLVTPEGNAFPHGMAWSIGRRGKSTYFSSRWWDEEVLC